VFAGIFVTCGLENQFSHGIFDSPKSASGPFSVVSPASEEHPGPPLNQTITGAQMPTGKIRAMEYRTYEIIMRPTLAAQPRTNRGKTSQQETTP
jgi:hypothetical protein